ncbi:MAG: hypothetical protein H7Y31_14265 [Chitinophagaceae bacterium]|nr:hypothetical protein [Chitinophagaceae bacterium]
MKSFVALLLCGCFIVTKLAAQERPVDSLKRLLSVQDSRERFAILIKICEEYRSSNPDSSLHYSQKAITIAKASNDSVMLARAELFSAYYFYASGKSDSALLIADRNIALLSRSGKEISLLAQFSSFSGLCMMKLDRKKDALERFYAALKLAESSNDYMTQARAHVNIGWALMESHQFEKAINSFHQGLSILSDKQLFLRNVGTLYNNMASSFGSLNQVDSAKKYATLGIESGTRNNDLFAQANGYFILGTAYEKSGDLENALSNFKKAQPIREELADPYFIVSDLAEISNLYAKLGRSDEGIATSLKALDLAEKNKIDAKLPMIYNALAANYEAKADYKNASIIYKKLGDLKDSLYDDANPKALAEMAAKYETEKKEQQILLQRVELGKKNLVIAAIGVLVVLAILLAISAYRRYQLKQKAELQAQFLRQQEVATKAILEAEERERQRIAKDLHDGVGQIMSAAKMNLSAFENELNFDSPEQKMKFEKIITLVDESCREVRSVSHNMMPNALLKAGLASAVREFTDKIDDRVIKIDLYSEGLNERLDTNLETVLYRVIQECVNNVIKHSKANHLDISLIRDNDGISATIEDNGRGFDTTDTEKFEGLGMRNIRTRVEYLKGSVEYDSKPGKGTVVAIHVPSAM